MKNQIQINRLIVISLIALTSCSNNPTDIKDQSLKIDGNKVKTDTTYSIGKPQYESFKDLGDGRVYKTVKIGNQVWMAENLNTNKFRDGSLIPKNMWSWYDNDKSNGEKYGALYTWHAIKDKRNIAPKGWHIPSPQEWDALFKYLGGDEFDIEEKLKKIGWSPKRGGGILICKKASFC